MSDDKQRHTVWLRDEAWDVVESHYHGDNCSTRNEFIEKAIRFYAGYLDTNRADVYLPEVVAEIMEGKLVALGDRMGKLLFKMCVEQSMMMHILAADTDIDLETLDRLRGRCVNDAKRTHGEFDFADAVRFQKGL